MIDYILSSEGAMSAEEVASIERRHYTEIGISSSELERQYAGDTYFALSDHCPVVVTLLASE